MYQAYARMCDFFDMHIFGTFHVHFYWLTYIWAVLYFQNSNIKLNSKPHLHPPQLQLLIY